MLSTGFGYPSFVISILPSADLIARDVSEHTTRGILRQIRNRMQEDALAKLVQHAQPNEACYLLGEVASTANDTSRQQLSAERWHLA